MSWIYADVEVTDKETTNQVGEAAEADEPPLTHYCAGGAPAA